MARFRMTVRYQGPAQRYHMADLEGESLVHALRLAVDAVPVEVDRTADLVEIRRTPGEERDYAPG